MIRKFLIIFSVILIAGKTSGQCVIDSLTISFADCQEGLADVWLDFEHSGGGNDLFRVKGNGINYGEFAYAELPVNIGPLKIDPYQYYEFGVQDLTDGACTNYIDYGFISCGDSLCNFQNLTITALDNCRSGESYAVELDFQSTGMTHFDIFLNGEFYKFAAIEDLPLTIDIPSEDSSSDNLMLRANDQPDCFITKRILVPPCDGECGISGLYTRALECDSGAFYVKLGFEHDGAHGNRFTIKVNGSDYGSFSYADIPVYLGPFEPGEHESLEFVVRDSLFSACHLASVVDGNPCREVCSIGKPVTDIIHCDSGFFSVSLDFDYEGDLSDSFKVKGNGKIYGLFAYADLPIVLTDLNADGQTQYEFAVLDQKRHDCNNYTDLGTVDCYCLWSDMSIASGDCTSDSTYVIEVDFAPGNVEAFSLYTEGQKLGEYAVSDLPLRLTDFPAGGGAFDELWICAALTNCCIKYELESPICARDKCSIRDVKVAPMECENGQYLVKLDFLYDGNQSDYFIVKSDGDVVGEYRYDELPVKLGPFWAHDSTVMLLQICDAQAHDCHVAVEIMSPTCPCDFGENKVEVGECTTDSTYRVILNPQLEGSFDFYVNGHFCGTFNSDQLPLVFDDFPASGGAYDYIKICALDSNYCCTEQKIESPACARNLCQLDGIYYEVTECNPNQQFYVKISMDTVGDPSGTFIIQHNNDLLEFSYDALPVKIGPYTGGNDFYKFKIYDSDSPDCRKELTLGRVVCSQQCDLSFKKVDIVECTENDGYILMIDSMDGSFSAFDMYFGDHYLGFHKEEKLPLRLKVPGPIKNDGTQIDSVLVRICVSDNTTCCFTLVLALPNCEEQECHIDHIQLDTFECRNDSFWVNVDFESLPEDSSIYKLAVNGDFVREFVLQDLPLHVGPFLAKEEKYAFLVRSTLFPDCVAETHFEGIECPGTQIAVNQRLLILESANYTNYVRVPEFIAERSLFQLVDLSGRVLYQMEFSSETNRALIELPVDVAGMYLIKIRSSHGESHLSKIIIP